MLNVRIPLIFHHHHIIISICSILKQNTLLLSRATQMENLPSRSNTCLFTEKCEEDSVKNHFNVTLLIHADEVVLNFKLKKVKCVLFYRIYIKLPGYLAHCDVLNHKIRSTPCVSDTS